MNREGNRSPSPRQSIANSPPRSQGAARLKTCDKPTDLARMAFTAFFPCNPNDAYLFSIPRTSPLSLPSPQTSTAYTHHVLVDLHPIEEHHHHPNDPNPPHAYHEFLPTTQPAAPTPYAPDFIFLHSLNPSTHPPSESAAKKCANTPTRSSRAATASSFPPTTSSSAPSRDCSPRTGPRPTTPSSVRPPSASARALMIGCAMSVRRFGIWRRVVRGTDR